MAPLPAGASARPGSLAELISCPGFAAGNTRWRSPRSFAQSGSWLMPTYIRRRWMTMVLTTRNASCNSFESFWSFERESPMTRSQYGEAIEILLVEDSPDDIVLTVEALKDGKVRNRVSVVEDGEEAMAFLRRQGKHVKAPRPDLILLDLNLPKKSGKEVLAEVKTDLHLKRIPVVIMTTSKEE